MQFHLDQAIGAAGVIAWVALSYRAGIWTRRQRALREMMETAAHGVTAGALLVLALNGLPKLPRGACQDLNSG